MSGSAMSSAMFDGFTEPPYWMRTAAAASSPATSATTARTKRAHRLGVVGGGGAAGADGPDRLVGDDQRRDCSAARPGEAGPHLAVDLGLGAAGLALLEGLAHAHDRRHPVRAGRP